MSGDEPGAAGPVSWPLVGTLVAAGAGAAAIGALLPPGPALEAWYLAFLVAIGFAMGALGLLMLGHVLSEDWLNPVLAETEAAARTVPLLSLLALPLLFRLSELLPSDLSGLPPARAAWISPAAIGLRAAMFVTAWSALAFWLTTTRRPWRASAVGLALMVPTVTIAAGDFVLAREPRWWPGLFGAAYAGSQLVAALAGAILVSLLRRERPNTVRMQSLRSALVVLALLCTWMWFAQFLIAWLANLPDEAGWYGARTGLRLAVLAGIGLPALLGAVGLLVLAGYGRGTLMTGAALALVAHAALTLWLARPEGRGPLLSWWDAAVPGGLFLLWAAWFAAAFRRRPTYRSELDVEEAVTGTSGR